jgi:hypothetical protein
MDKRLLPALLLGGALLAQEPAPADPNVLLSTALRRIKIEDSLAATVDVKHEPPEQPGGPAGMVVTTEIMGEDPPFEGKVEALRDADGTAVLLSAAELPGFAIYAGQGRVVERTTFEESRFSLDQLRTEVLAMLDADAFTDRLLDAKLEPSRDAATGDLKFSGKVDRDIVPPTEGGNPFLQGRVLEAHASVVVTAEGGLKTCAIKITRSDPTREMMRGERRIIIRGGGGGVPPGLLPPPDDDKKHDIVGGSTTYTISFSEGGPSDRMKAFRQEIERLLKAQGPGGDPLPPAEGGAEDKK